jgi:hypothetical protein
MPSDSFVLREFAYFDRQKVEDFVSAIEDGLTTETTEIRQESGSNLGGSLGVPGVASIQGGVSKKGDVREQLRKATDASIFQSLHKYLTDSKQLRRLSAIDAETWAGIREKEMLEIVGQIEPSTMQVLLEIIERMIPLAESQKVDSGRFEIIRALSSYYQSIPVKISLDDTKYIFVATLPKQKLRSSLQELSAEYEILCRVQRKLAEGETLDLFSLAPGMELSTELNEQLINASPTAVERLLGKRITMDDLRIGFPAVVVTPIAVYR